MKNILTIILIVISIAAMSQPSASSITTASNGLTKVGKSVELGGNANKVTDVEIGHFAIGFSGDGFSISAGNLQTYAGLTGYDSSVVISANKSVVFIGDLNCTFQSAGGDVKIIAGDSIKIDAGSGVLVMHNDVIPNIDNYNDHGRSNDRWARDYTVIRVQQDTVFVPTTGQTVTVRAGYYSIIKPAAGLLALTIALPSSPQNGYAIELKFTQAITTLSYSGGTVSGSALTAIALTNPYQKLVYNSGTATWY